MEIKKRVRLALVHYHPDKYQLDPMKTQVLMEEISKEINKFYDNLKQPSVSAFE